MSGGYKTKGREILYDFFKTQDGKRFCAKDITDYFDSMGYSMNQSTVYRNLERMSREGVLFKTKQASDDFSYYQYIGEHRDCHEHLHMQCKKCGKVVHLENPGMDDFYKRLRDDHGFELKPMESVLVGVCSDCNK